MEGGIFTFPHHFKKCIEGTIAPTPSFHLFFTIKGKVALSYCFFPSPPTFKCSEEG
jgi:hypothetical protein